MNPLNIIILAAGQGTRMNSRRPKVLHTLAHKSLLAHVLDSAHALQPRKLIVVHGHGGAEVQQAFAHVPLTWVEQTQQLGTAHAVSHALPQLDDNAQVLILYGDVPLISAATLRALCAHTQDHIGILTATLPDPRGYGRIVRDANGQIQAIIEEKDADAAIRALNEINTGIMCFPSAFLQTHLKHIHNQNAQGEYYLTDIIALAVAASVPVISVNVTDIAEIMGVNDFVQLATLERLYQRRQSEMLMRQGVYLRDPARFEVRGEIECGLEVEIDVNVILEGTLKIGTGVRIGAGCVIRNCVIGDNTEILPYSVLENAIIGAHCRIGPFARLRPHTVLGAHVHIGNFVELKQSQVGEYTKINHLSYIGDSTIGREVNIGAGSITCNYDGVNKHRTHIGDRAFIGSNTQMVAPLEIGAGATIGAGSVITRDAPPEQLTLSRSPQVTHPQWVRPQKQNKKQD
jgi:bifunctional UDP-N-acetylglucosamine pyrophosphorylase / glucosamine-1-phosphate N-acetyltransferase